MNTEKQRAFIIHFVYSCLILALLYLFLRYVMYAIMPFLIGFLIAFMLRPLIKRLTALSGGHEKLWSSIVILVFYATIGAFVTYQDCISKIWSRFSTIRWEMWKVYGRRWISQVRRPSSPFWTDCSLLYTVSYPPCPSIWYPCSPALRPPFPICLSPSSSPSYPPFSLMPIIRAS